MEGGRDRHRERDRDTDRERGTERERGGQKQRERERHTHREGGGGGEGWKSPNLSTIPVLACIGVSGSQQRRVAKSNLSLTKR